MSDSFVNPWTVVCQAPFSMEFSMQGYWSGFLCPFPGDLPSSGKKPISSVPPTLQADSLPLSHPRAAAAKSLQSCPTLCNPIDGSPPGSPIPGILQARTLEWVAMCSHQRIFLTQGSKLSPVLQADSLPTEPQLCQ